MLRIMSLNINYYVDRHGPWQVRQGLILEAIRSAQPDIIALQAVRQAPSLFGGENQAVQLAGRLDGFKHVFFQPAMRHLDGAEDGLAILARLPFTRTGSLPLTLLPGLDDASQRVLLAAEFDLPSGPLTLFNAHFSWVQEQLQKNVAEALPYIQSVEGPALLVGDLNAPAGQGLLEGFRHSGWVDGWEALCGDEPGLTFENGNLSIRIDYGWANPSLAARLQSIEVIANQVGPAGEHISDHLGLLVTIRV